VSQIGDSASVQAATRVNSEQAINVTDALESLDEGVGIGRNNANCEDCGSRWDNKQTAPVGSFKPNAFGLFDMLGNVHEWTCSQYKRSDDGSEQKCAVSASKYSLRGGSWFHAPWWVRAASRLGYPDNRGPEIGFRLARD
jgi:formylglycine-generating enzyme required for sulfatase activity